VPAPGWPCRRLHRRWSDHFRFQSGRGWPACLASRVWFAERRCLPRHCLGRHRHFHGGAPARLAVEEFEVVLPEPAFQLFVTALGREKRQSQYSYGFADGDGDCNCITWIERLGLPLLTGQMDEFMALPGRASHPSRRFGRCL
jgi:hypothetical protein